MNALYITASYKLLCRLLIGLLRYASMFSLNCAITVCCPQFKSCPYAKQNSRPCSEIGQFAPVNTSRRSLRLWLCCACCQCSPHFLAQSRYPRTDASEVLNIGRCRNRTYLQAEAGPGHAVRWWYGSTENAGLENEGPTKSYFIPVTSTKHGNMSQWYKVTIHGGLASLVATKSFNSDCWYNLFHYYEVRAENCNKINLRNH